jgi:hypothetical protein
MATRSFIRTVDTRAHLLERQCPLAASSPRVASLLQGASTAPRELPDKTRGVHGSQVWEIPRPSTQANVKGAGGSQARRSMMVKREPELPVNPDGWLRPPTVSARAPKVQDVRLPATLALHSRQTTYS